MSETDRGTILLVDDDPAVRRATEQWLSLAGFQVICVDSAAAARPHLQADFPGILVTDVRMPVTDGLALMAEARAIDPEMPVILITGHGDVAMAVQAMHDGAYDFIEKPFKPEHLSETLGRACRLRRLELENRALKQRLSRADDIAGRLLGTSAAIERLRGQILELAPTSANVVVLGETGTGKELVSRCLHDFGPRSGGHFVAVNCGAIPETLFESELFGHETGAFTGAQGRRIGRLEHASGGTLLLDEIESMPLSLQVKLLRALQEKAIERLGANVSIPIDVRVVAATKVDLRQASADGTFREDLYYRLNVATLYLPPLRERVEDLPLLFEVFTDQAARLHDRQPPPLSAADLAALRHHVWPGNVRELKNVAERYVLGLGGRSSVVDILEGGAPSGLVGTNAPPGPLADRMRAFEKTQIEDALRRHGGNVKAVLDELDLPRRTLNEKMSRLGINRQLED